MRALAKVDEPEILRRKRDGWTEKYLAAIEAGEALKPREKWRHAEIKIALREELLGKCAYCEGYVEDVAFPHVEHIIPKVVRPDLAHRWDNLTSACERCNIAKGDFYDSQMPLLNPYTDRLDEHLVFLGDLITWKLGSEPGELTIGKLDLNRYEIAHSRARRLGDIRQVLERWHEASGAKKELLAAGLRLDAREGEFTAVVTAYLASFGFPL